MKKSTYNFDCPQFVKIRWKSGSRVSKYLVLGVFTSESEMKAMAKRAWEEIRKSEKVLLKSNSLFVRDALPYEIALHT